MHVLPPAPGLTPHHRRRYAYDTIHNTIAKSRSQLERGGYSRVSPCPFSEAAYPF